MIKQSLFSLLRDSRIRVAGVLTGVWVIGVLLQPSLSRVIFPLLSVILMIIFDLLFAKVKGEKMRFPSSSLVTGLLIGFILEPFGHPLSVVLATVLASASKGFLRFGNRHIFNPAALGLVVTSIATGAPIAWWAAAGSSLTIPVIALGAGFILYKIRRLWLPITFLLTYALYLGAVGAVGAVGGILPLVFDGTTFLFAFVMLPEPMTSPNRDWWKFIWGPLIIGIMFVYQRLLPSFTDPFLLSLLSANFIWSIWRKFGTHS